MIRIVVSCGMVGMVVWYGTEENTSFLPIRNQESFSAPASPEPTSIFSKKPKQTTTSYHKNISKPTGSLTARPDDLEPFPARKAGSSAKFYGMASMGGHGWTAASITIDGKTHSGSCCSQGRVEVWQTSVRHSSRQPSD